MSARAAQPAWRKLAVKNGVAMCRTCMLPLPRCLCWASAHDMTLWVDAIRAFACRARSNKRWGSR